jgi:hypothetical protein
MLMLNAKIGDDGKLNCGPPFRPRRHAMMQAKEQWAQAERRTLARGRPGQLVT